MIVRIHPHARQRMRERGATTAEIQQTIDSGVAAPVKFGRTRFRRVFSFSALWNGKHFASKQIDAFAAKIPGGWLVVTVIVKYF
jgi:hypothetical protein